MAELIEVISSSFQSFSFVVAEVLEEEVHLEEVFNLRGKRHGLKGVPFDVKKDVFDMKSKFHGDVNSFWGTPDEVR